LHTRRTFLLSATGAAAVSATSFAAQETDFYRGKQLRFLVGIPPGGAYDLIPRILAAHISAYIPGRPSIVVENMPGASSLIMMNYLYNNAPRDGTVVGFPMNSVILEPTLHLISRSGGAIGFDLGKMTWLGSVGQDPTVLWVGAKSGIKAFSELLHRKVRLAATTPAADSYLIETLCNKLMKTDIQIISGYEGVAQYVVAFERGEVDGAATTHAALAADRPTWMRDGEIRFLAQFGAERSPTLPEVPTGAELASDPETKAALRLFGEKFTATYPVVLGPGVPSDRASMLQTAFDQTMQDKAFIQQIKKLYLAPGGISSAKIAEIVKSVDDAPRSVIEQIKSALET
jgi:tripartite-type tricarboxylate transporter receptor subunit TctC